MYSVGVESSDIIMKPRFVPVGQHAQLDELISLLFRTDDKSTNDLV
jgi:hypothetical protein